VSLPHPEIRVGGDRLGWVQMSRQDLQRIEVLTEVLAGRRTTVSAAGVLGVSLRQAQRLLARYRAGGGGAMIHRSRGRPASNRLGPGVQEYVLELVRQNYASCPARARTPTSVLCRAI
jgi:hypothetical protein